MPSVIRNTVAGQYDVRINLSDILPKFRELPKRLGTAVVRRGLLAGARVVGEEARALAPQPRPKSTRRKKVAASAPIAKGEKGYWARGNLKKAIGWETRGVFRDASGVPVEHRAVVLVKKPRGGGRNVRSYAHMVEYGTQPHHMGKGAITTVFKRSKKTANPVGAMHPGARPRPFMRPAYDAKSGEALRTIEQVVRRELVVELGKLRTAKVMA